MGISPTTRGLGPRRVQANSKQAITYNKLRARHPEYKLNK